MSGFLRAWQAEIERAHAEMDRREHCLDAHGYGCARAECGRRVVSPSEIVGFAEFLEKETK